jgi:glycosyltransferase involved in cell wall biosynthesis
MENTTRRKSQLSSEATLSQVLPYCNESKTLTPARDAGDAAPRRVLFVSYVFPPVGGAGVQRTTKFVKYLPGLGWMPSVLTVANPSVPAWDESLVGDIGEDVIVRRARTLEPSYAVKSTVSANEAKGVAKKRGMKAAVKGAVRGAVKLVLQPDPQVLWAPAALAEGKRLLAEIPHDVILVSGPPFSSFLVGAKLSNWAGIPLVLDYRDEWDISNTYLENKKLDRGSLWLQKKMQWYAMRTASAVVATTQSSARALAKIRDACGSKARVECIYNGYDPLDFPTTPARAAAGRDKFRLAYVGTLWNLTSIAPVVEAVELLATRAPDLAKKLELVVVGRRTEQQQTILARLRHSPCSLVEHPYLPHDEALQLVRGADALCVLLSDVAGAERVVPAKIFEYMAAKRTILGVAPRGEMWDLLRDHPAAHLHEPRDVQGIAASLEHDLKSLGHGNSEPAWDFDATQHSRPAEAAQLARLLASLSDAKGGRHARH